MVAVEENWKMVKTVLTVKVSLGIALRYMAELSGTGNRAGVGGNCW